MQESERVDAVMMSDREHMRDAVFFEGPEADLLRKELEKRGVDPSHVQVELVPARHVTFD